MKVLLVTNDFPPRVGGIQSYLWNIYRRLAATGTVEVRVLAPAFPGDTAFDAASGMEVTRWPGAMMWPTPALGRRIRRLAHEADVVAFGAVLPMNLISPRLDRPTVIHTHGFEVAWARLPLLRARLRRIARAASVVTVISDFTRRFIERALGEEVPTHMLRTGVDLDQFTPDADGASVRKRFGLDGKPVVSCVSRLVPRKGQDQIIRALPLIRREVPDATALIVGDGPVRTRLEKLARDRNVQDAVVFSGEAPEAELAAHYAAGDVFAMPCRSRFAGLEVEGLGLVYLEAQACERPAITGDSGGAPEAVIPNQTGFVVPGRDTRALAARTARLLADPATARAMGKAGRTFVEENHRWEDVVARYYTMLVTSM
jgi:phosphatidylinositol alpha-1,6-mannosyltransferase